MPTIDPLVCLVCAAFLTIVITEGETVAPGPEEFKPLSKDQRRSKHNTLFRLDDIKYTEEQQDWLNTPPDLRTGVIFANEKWPEATVPYSVSRNLPKEQRRIIPKSIKMIEEQTCVKFVKRTTEKNYVEILRKEPGSCWSRLGYLGSGKQELNLGGWDDGKPCSVASTAHELLHTLGIEHEQNRPDRDDYITVDFDKIPEGWRSQYEKEDPSKRSSYGVPYGYDSIMHYPLTSPDGSGTQVMFPKQEVNFTIGDQDHISQGDIDLINAMYNCS